MCNGKAKTHLTALEFLLTRKQFLEMLISLEFWYDQILPKLDNFYVNFLRKIEFLN